MKLFIKNIIVFITSFLLLFLMIYYMGKIGMEAISYYKLPKETKYVVFGHSHSECAYNDSLIDNLANFANSGESYFYTYLKARKLISNNKQIEVVFIEYSNNQITKEMDNWTWDDTYLPIRLPTYLPLMDNSDLKFLNDNNPSMFRNQIIKATLKNIFHNYKTIAINGNSLNNNMRFGGYLSLTNSVVDSLILHSAPKLKKNHDPEISQININYLEKTIRLCEKNNKKVILIRTPVHEKCEELINEESYQEILKSRFANVDFVDFRNFKLRNSEFYDLAHLNLNGAKKFSQLFNRLIIKGLLDKKNKQSFIDNEIQSEQTIEQITPM